MEVNFKVKDKFRGEEAIPLDFIFLSDEQQHIIQTIVNSELIEEFQEKFNKLIIDFTTFITCLNISENYLYLLKNADRVRTILVNYFGKKIFNIYNNSLNNSEDIQTIIKKVFSFQCTFQDLSNGEVKIDISNIATIDIIAKDYYDEEVGPLTVTITEENDEVQNCYESGKIFVYKENVQNQQTLHVQPYKTFSIKVLDIRSGSPIKKAKVKKLIVRNSYGNTIGINDKIDDDNKKLQAQLKYIYMKHNNKYRDPGDIDGILGKVTEPEPETFKTTEFHSNRVSKTRYAIRKFREANELSKSFIKDYELKEKDIILSKLNISQENVHDYLKKKGVLPSEFKYSWEKNLEGTLTEKAKKVLERLGFYEENISDACNSYWQSRINKQLNSSANDYLDDFYLENIVKEYEGYIETDENGILQVRIPRVFLNDHSAYLDIGFWDFPIAVEELSNNAGSISRSDHENETPKENEPTGFVIRWIGEQKLEWSDYFDDQGAFIETAHFGWQVSKGIKCSNLKAGIRIPIYDSSKATLFSKYFHATNYPHHFVLFGMQWCQPVWDEFTDPLNEKSINVTSYVQKSNLANLHMHIVTTYLKLSGSEKYNGKGYGKVEAEKKNSNEKPKWRGSYHKGIDLHAKVRDCVFAVHGGCVENGIETKIKGKFVRFKFKDQKIDYLHLNQFIDSLHNKRVLAGTIVGEAGRTGNLKTVWPGHVHLNINAVGGEEVGLRNSPDESNKICIPFNEIPLLMPCKSEIKANNPKDCNFENKNFVNTCWAVAELKCPHMSSKEQVNIMRVQAQLRYLNENDPDNYIDPGPIDGDDGGLLHGGDVNGKIGDTILPYNKENGAEDDNFKDNEYRRVVVKTVNSEIYGWTQRTKLGDYKDKEGKYILKEELEKLNCGGYKKKEISKTRQAIYNFREKAEMLIKGPGITWENYEIDESLLTKLNKEAPISEPEMTQQNRAIELC